MIQNINNNNNNSAKNLDGDELSTKSGSAINNIPNSDDVSKIITWVIQLKDPKMRESSLNELSKMREEFSNLAIFLWYSPGIVATLLQEIINTYKLLAPPSLNMQSSNIACNVLALFQCIAAHPETRQEFVKGVIGALVKVDNPEMIEFLLTTEIIPLCLRIMEKGSDLSKTVATFIVQRILLDDNGLNYMCSTADRFFTVTSVLSNMTSHNTSTRLLKHIIRSYARLAEYPKVQKPLKENLPALFRDKDFTSNLDDASKRWLGTLFKSLSNNPNQRDIPEKKFNNVSGNGAFGMPSTFNNMGKSNPFLGQESSIYFNGDTKFMNPNKQ